MEIQNKKPTPMMAQWESCKETAGNSILFFRMGDFYEAFYEDAKILAKELEITLTKRQEIPMSGIPVSTVENYIDKLVAKGYSVAVAEQLEDPKETKGIVKRGVVRILSPGTLISSNLIDAKSNHYFASITQVGKVFGLSFIDISCSEFQTTEFETLEQLKQELYRLAPKELIVTDKFITAHGSFFNCMHHSLDIWCFDPETAYQTLKDHFQLHSLDGFGLQGKTASISASGALLSYIKSTHHLNLKGIEQLGYYSQSMQMGMNQVTELNLELLRNREGNTKHTLLELLDKTKTGMGGRLLRKWIKTPLLDLKRIERRQMGIKAFFSHPAIVSPLTKCLLEIQDLERLTTKLSMGCINPKELYNIATSLKQIPTIVKFLEGIPIFEKEIQKLDPLSSFVTDVEKTLKNPPPIRLSDGHVIQDHISNALDEYRLIRENTKQFLIDYQTKIKNETGIKTLKVGFNRMFGYYLEVSRGQANLVPENFERRQTLVNQERFITPELKEFEQKALSAEEMITKLEKELYNHLVEKLAPFQKQLFKIAKTIALIDTLLSLYLVADENKYSCPLVDESSELSITDGRHPIIEKLISDGEFVSNDTELDHKDHQLYIITGPNMAGKSTYIRQVALIVVMAQMGSFVPATKAHIGLIDQVFTRIGASDDLSRGQSTFMVEMAETANILNNATNRSLVLLDEIGRGTSTYDGISIAWSVAEYLLTQPNRQAKTLFATHYFELTKLESEIPGACNFHSAVKETDNGILFLRKILPGGTDRSYGIHVARLAGLPSQCLVRAHEILNHLEEASNQKSLFTPPKKRRTRNAPSKEQLLLF
ncbi:DNA mismatch repair protein MutS [Chlamydiales bacterium]|nr:DNA mismatch repair protein MutS [Chlamydiales bacterium]